MNALRYLSIALTPLIAAVAVAQAPKGDPAPGAGERVLSYHGLVPGVDTHEKVLDVLGEPAAAAQWYNYKLSYPADGRDGMLDVVHLTGPTKTAKVASVEAASVPKGYENEGLIKEKLGDPEYVLRMYTWSLLDYSEKGLRFTTDVDGKTTGVAYFVHGWPRVHTGARKLVDLRKVIDPKAIPGYKPMTADSVAELHLECATAEVDISPLEDDWLPYPYEVINPLKARIVVLRQGALCVAFVGADLFGFGAPDVAVIREAAKEADIDYVILGSSHTHTSGDTMGFYGFLPSKFIAHIQNQVIAGLKEATQQFVNVDYVHGVSTEMPMDGTRVQGLIRNARNPAVMDPTLNVITLGAGGEAIATIINFACHPESVDSGEKRGLIDADYPGYMCAKLHEMGGFGQPVFLNGALGGMVSGDNAERTPESSKETGERFAALVSDLVQNGKSNLQPGDLKAETKRVEIPLTNAEWRPMFEADNARRSLYRGRVVTDMTYIQLGTAQFVSLPGEMLPEVSFEVKEHMHGFPAMLIGLGNDQMGYMVPPYDFRDNVYEEKTSVGPAMATEVRDTAIRMVEGIE